MFHSGGAVPEGLRCPPRPGLCVAPLCDQVAVRIIIGNGFLRKRRAEEGRSDADVGLRFSHVRQIDPLDQRDEPVEQQAHFLACLHLPVLDRGADPVVPQVVRDTRGRKVVQHQVTGENVRIGAAEAEEVLRALPQLVVGVEDRHQVIVVVLDHDRVRAVQQGPVVEETHIRDTPCVGIDGVIRQEGSEGGVRFIDGRLHPVEHGGGKGRSVSVQELVRRNGRGVGNVETGRAQGRKRQPVGVCLPQGVVGLDARMIDGQHPPDLFQVTAPDQQRLYGRFHRAALVVAAGGRTVAVVDGPALEKQQQDLLVALPGTLVLVYPDEEVVGQVHRLAGVVPVGGQFPKWVSISRVPRQVEEGVVDVLRHGVGEAVHQRLVLVPDDEVAGGGYAAPPADGQLVAGRIEACLQSAYDPDADEVGPRQPLLLVEVVVELIEVFTRQDLVRLELGVGGEDG